HVEGPIVDPAHQRRGIGTALFGKFEEDAIAHGVHVLEAGVRARNVRGLQFIERLGYEKNRRIAVYECHERFTGGYALAEGYTIGELKPRYLLPFLMVMHECFPDYRLPSNPQRLFEPDKMKIFLALDAADKPVGAVTAFFYPEDRMAYIYHLGVSAPQRGFGIARALLVSACDWLWDVHDPRFIGLSASANSHGDPTLYEQAGFELQYALQFCKKSVKQTAGT
ncbi:MAG TPA: GNAT family N-acetyltransferase, partial [Oscillatoriaceae cyanobacterium]